MNRFANKFQFFPLHDWPLRNAVLITAARESLRLHLTCYQPRRFIEIEAHAGALRLVSRLFSGVRGGRLVYGPITKLSFWFALPPTRSTCLLLDGRKKMCVLFRFLRQHMTAISFARHRKKASDKSCTTAGSFQYDSELRGVKVYTQKRLNRKSSLSRLRSLKSA